MFGHGQDGIGRVVEQFNRNFKSIEKHLNEVMTYQQTQIAKDLTKSAISQMMGYNRMIITVGFAAVVASWIQFKPDMHPLVFRIAGLCWMTSVSVFVWFEIWKMVSTNKQQAKQLEEVADRMATAKNIRSALAVDVERFFKVWRRAFYVILIPGVASAALIMGSAAIATWNETLSIVSTPAQDSKETPTYDTSKGKLESSRKK